MPFPNAVRDVPNQKRDVPNRKKAVPNGVRDVPNQKRGVPNGNRDVPNQVRDVPNRKRELPNEIRDVPNGVGERLFLGWWDAGIGRTPRNWPTRHPGALRTARPYPGACQVPRPALHSRHEYPQVFL